MTAEAKDQRRVEAYELANRYLNEGLIRADASAALDVLLRSSDASGQRRPNRKDRMRAFLPRLEHPERSFGAIHVGGTSGKGSIAIMVAEILAACNERVALHVTPYLQVATEKFWANGRYASVEEFASLVDWIRPHAEACRADDVPMHGMASVAITLEYFRRQQVRYGVMEVGVGGRNDLTNVLQTKVAVIGAVGLDHLKTLGPTIDDIAWHKAGIIQAGARAVALEGPGLAAAREQAQEVGAELRVIGCKDYRAQREKGQPLRLSFLGRKRKLEELSLGMGGDFQGQNAALALAAIEELEIADGLDLDEGAIRRGLRRARLPGRAELMPPLREDGATVLLDGAHNPDKLAALLATVSERRYAELHVVFGGLGSRAPDAALQRLAQLAKTMVCTEPRVYRKPPRPAEEIAELVRGTTRAIIARSPLDAMAIADEQASPDDLILVTGSLYLVGEVRGLWIAPEHVLLERRSFLTSSEAAR